MEESDSDSDYEDFVVPQAHLVDDADDVVKEDNYLQFSTVQETDYPQPNAAAVGGQTMSEGEHLRVFESITSQIHEYVPPPFGHV